MRAHTHTELLLLCLSSLSPVVVIASSICKEIESNVEKLFDKFITESKQKGIQHVTNTTYDIVNATFTISFVSQVQ